MREESAGLVDDFRAGVFEVGFPIGRIVVLVGIEVAIRVGIVDFAAEADGAVGAFGGVAVDGLGAVRFEDFLALLGGVGGEDELHLVSAVGADHGVGDAGIAAGGVEDRAGVVELAGAFAVEDHVGGGAVLDGAAGVEVFGLGEDLDTGEFGGNLVETQEWGVADGREQGLGLGPGEVWNGENVGHAHLLGFILGSKDANTACI